MAGRGEILPDWKIKELMQKGVIIDANESLINPSSLDLRLGMIKWKLLGSFLPSGNRKIESELEISGIVDGVNRTKEEYYVDTSHPYLMKLVESLDLPESLTARIHNKSGRGRIGIAIKGLVDRVSRFDHIPAGYKGKLYAEVCATTFPIVTRSGETAIPQIRFYNGEPQPLQGIDLDLLLRETPILTDEKGNPSYSKREKSEIISTGELTFHADLSSDLLVYKAIRDRKTIVLSERGKYNVEDFFEPVMRRPDRGGVVVVHPGDFVLVKSKENIRLPPEIAAEISEYSSELGDFRTHYAGLINAGHGYNPDSTNIPSYILFEVRARDVPVVLQDGQRLAKFEIHKMLDLPEQSYMAKRSTDFNDLKSFLPGVFKKC